MPKPSDIVLRKSEHQFQEKRSACLQSPLARQLLSMPYSEIFETEWSPRNQQVVCQRARHHNVKIETQKHNGVLLIRRVK